MECNAKDGSNYLDGVPVRISGKFLPPRDVKLPFNLDSIINTEVLDDVYDFALEKNVIENHTRRLLQQIENNTVENTSPGMPENNTQSDDKNQTDHVPNTQSNNQTMLPWQSNTILLPKPQQVQEKVSSEDSENKHVKINLSDFENDTSSPFDYMELQTINDFEELSSVFQGINSNNGSQEESTCMSNNSDVHVNVSKSKSFPFPTSSKEVEAFQDMTIGRDFGRGSLPTSSYAIPQMISNATPLKQVEDFPGDTYLKLSQVPYITSNAGACSRPVIARVPALLRGSKSYSDISNLDQTENTHFESQRSRTPPSTLSYSTNLEVNESKETSENGICDANLPDPYDELEDSAKEFVDSITEMGFSRPQVARTVKHLGTDEKKVVEHLCQIQALEESGYEGLDAEAALHLHDYNRDEAKMFLDLVSQFQDLGFEKNAVKKALVQNKNDWNKTIDALLLS